MGSNLRKEFIGWMQDKRHAKRKLLFFYKTYKTMSIINIIWIDVWHWHPDLLTMFMHICFISIMIISQHTFYLLFSGQSFKTSGASRLASLFTVYSKASSAERKYNSKCWWLLVILVGSIFLQFHFGSETIFIKPEPTVASCIGVEWSNIIQWSTDLVARSLVFPLITHLFYVMPIHLYSVVKHQSTIFIFKSGNFWAWQWQCNGWCQVQ